MGAFAPYVFASAYYRGYTWKILSFYAFYRVVHSIYDYGKYANFFAYGPGQMKRIVELDPKENFASI